MSTLSQDGKEMADLNRRRARYTDLPAPAGLLNEAGLSSICWENARRTQPVGRFLA
jgi:hypothetical protein